MTPDQWKHITQYIHTNWGTTPAWTQAAHLYTDVQDLPYPTMATIAKQIRDEGRQYPPPPAELIGRTKQRQGPPLTPALPEPQWQPLTPDQVRAAIMAVDSDFTRTYAKRNPEE